MAVQLRTTMVGDAKKLAPAYSDIVIYAEGIPANILNTKYNVKYRCSIFIDGVNVAVLKAPPNNNRKAIFRISSILQDYTETDKSGYDLAGASSGFQNQSMLEYNHAIHQIDKFARNRSNLNNCICIGGYEYSNTPSGNIITIGSLGSDVNFNYFNSVLQHKDGYSTEGFIDYILNGNTKKFLTKFTNQFTNGKGQKIQLGQYHTVGFLNGRLYGIDFVNGQSTVSGIRYITYDANDTQIDALTITNSSINGGSSTNSIITGNFVNQTSNTAEGLLYFGCGTAQLEQNGLDLSNVAYYVVVAVSGGVSKSQSYRFDIQDADCKGYETIRLAFLNSLGAWDYYNFTKKSTRTTQINKSPIKQNYGYTPYLSTTALGDLVNYTYYNQGTYDGGTRVFNVNATETIEANTDFISEDEAAILEELFLSPDVYMQTGDIFEPVVINETEYIKQTTANDMLKQYIITIEKGHNKRVQRL